MSVFEDLASAAAYSKLIDSLGIPPAPETPQPADRLYGMRIGRSATRQDDDWLDEGRTLTDAEAGSLRAQLQRMRVRRSTEICPTLSLADAAAVLNRSQAEVLSLMEDRMLCRTYIDGELRVKISQLAGRLTSDTRLVEFTRG